MKIVKNNIHILLLTTIFALVLMGCKKEFLEVTPKGLLIAKTLADYDKLFSGTVIDENVEANIAFFGDDVCAMEPFFSAGKVREQSYFKWKDDIYLPEEDPLDLTGWFKNIYNYNKISNEVLNAKDGTEQQRLSLQGEARASRAWIHFLLVNQFGKPYRAGSAATDEGFPILTKSDISINSFERATVKEVYDFVLTELLAAYEQVPAMITNKRRLSKPAVAAYLGRVYVYMGNYGEGLKWLNRAFEGIANSSVPVKLYDYKISTLPKEAHQPTVLGPSMILAVNHHESLNYRTLNNNIGLFIYNPTYFINKATLALFDPADLRYKVFLTQFGFLSFTPYPGGLRRPTGRYQEPIIGANLPDMYLSRAECRARMGDLIGAAADLKVLRQHRMPVEIADIPAGLDKPGLIKYVIEERTREFAGMGDRWYTMRRLSGDPLFDIKPVHIIYATDGVTEKERIVMKPERLTQRLPIKIINQNPGIVNIP